jgi:hypothetical protein
MSIFSSWKFWLMVSFTAMMVAKCHPVAAVEPVVTQTTQIITPDGKLITCIRTGDVTVCF